MSKVGILTRHCFASRPSRRTVSSSSPRPSSSSPQRRARAALATAPCRARPFTDIPGPLALPMLRHSAHVLPRIGSFHHTVGLGLLEGLRSRYGDVVRLAKASRTRPVLYIFNPQLMQEVYESGVTDPPRWDGSPLKEQRKQVNKQCPIYGEESNAIWAAIRALMQDGAMMQNYEQAFDDIAADATQRFEELRKASNALNEELETELYRWALETLGMLIFGIRLGCLEGNTHVPTEENRSPQKHIDDDSPILCSLSQKPMHDLTPAERLVRCSKEIADGSYLVRSEDTLKRESATFDIALKAYDNHFSLTEHFLFEALQKLNSGPLRPEQSFLDKLRPLEHRILPLAADALLAGVDPLAQTALSMMYHFSLHAAQQQRAHDEVSWSKASKEAEASPQEMPYLSACAKEALRLHPATGGVVRRAREDLVVAGYEVPAGVDIVLAHGVSSKCDKEWGRPKAFIPERWCSEGWVPLRASKAHLASAMPFGEACPAAGAVGNMLTALATRLLDKYRLEWHGPSPNMVTTGVNKLQPPFYFVLKNAA